MHNPGTAPVQALASPGLADLIIVCEESYARYRSRDLQAWLAMHPVEWARAGFIVNGVPGREVAGLIRELGRRGGYLFVTELEDRFYERFGEAWVFGCNR